MILKSLGFIFILFVGVASAHQQKESYTTILFNERTGNLEISHRFYIHDAEHALAKEIKANADLHNDEETRKLFTYYVSENFTLKDSNDKLIPLIIVGSEVDGKYFWVYQETALQKRFSGPGFIPVQAGQIIRIFFYNVMRFRTGKPGCRISRDYALF